MTNVQECLLKLASEDEAERIYAAEDLGYANDAAAIAPLLDRLEQEPSRAVREAAFAALLQIDDDAVITGVLRLLDNEDSFLRNQAVLLLQARGSRVLPELERAFEDGGRDRRKFVIDVIARLPEADSSALYDRALHDPDVNVVITAVENIGRARRVRHRNSVIRLMVRDAHPMLLSACLEALSEIGDGDTLRAVRERLGPVETLPSYFLPSYVKLVGATGSAEDVFEIDRLAGHAWLDSSILNALTSLRNRIPGLLLPVTLAGPLQEMVSRNPPALAYQAVRLLSAVSNDEAIVRFLVSCLAHPEKVLRIGAIQALRSLGHDNVLRDRLMGETDEEVLQVCGFQDAR